MDEGVRAVLAGNFDLETLPDVPSRVIKVYLSSTLTDTIQERIAIAEKVYLRLRNYCREKYALEFQMVDLHWGESEEWSDDSPERELLWREIQQCQELSAGPNFVTLVGQHYGNQSLPSAISEVDFKLILNSLGKHRNRETRDAALLDRWYHRDSNVIPTVYRLCTPRPGQDIANINDLQVYSSQSHSSQNKCPTTWKETKRALLRLIHRGLDYAFQDGCINEVDKNFYLFSDLEHEVQQGFLHASDPHNTCLAFLRKIVDLKNYVPQPQTRQYVAMTQGEADGSLQVDPVAEAALEDMRENKIRKCLPPGNVYEFEVLWRFENGIDEKLHRDYLDRLCNTFYDGMCELVDQISHSESHVELPLSIDEAYQHWTMCKRYSKGFCRSVREPLLQALHSYVTSTDNRPLVLYGRAGSGKTSLVSQAAAEAPDWIQVEPVVIIRYLGLTTGCRDIRRLIHGICTQVAMLFDQEVLKVPTEFKELKAYFKDMLKTFPSDKALVICIDGIHLDGGSKTAKHGESPLSWLPLHFKSNVKLIVSAQADTREQLSENDRIDNDHLIEVTDFLPEQCLVLIDKWLSIEQRSVTLEQKGVLLQAFNICTNPLFVKLAYQYVRTLTSYETLSENVMALDVEQAIRRFLDDLEERRGRCLVSHALSYLVASDTGLSENEIEDVLSLDDDVFAEVTQHWHCPRFRRCPSLTWARLKLDLQDLMVRQNTEGVTVYKLNHQYFIQICKTRYMDDDKYTKRVHSLLADYFLGVWHEQSKPDADLTMNDNNNKGGEMHQAKMLVPDQPFTFLTETGEVKFNKRMYGQVPRHLYLAGRLKEFNELVLFSYEWIYNKTEALNLDCVLEDFAMNPGVEATLVEKALKDAQLYIEENIDCMPVELTGRLLAYYNTHPNIQKILSECDTMGLEQCSIIPNFPYHQIPGTPLKHTFRYNGVPTSFAFVGENSWYILVKDLAKSTVRMFDLVTGEHKSDICTSVGEMLVPPGGGNRLVIVDHMTEKAIKLHSIENGDFLGQMIPLNQIQLKPKEKYRLHNICLSNQHICIIVTTDKSYLFVGDLDGCRFLDVRGLEGKCTVCQITPDSRYVFCNSNDTLLSYDLQNFEKHCDTKLEYPPKQIVFRKDGTRGFLVNNFENKIHVMHLNKGNLDLIYKIVLAENSREDSIQNLTISNNEELLLLRWKHMLMVYHISTERVICNISRPEDIPTEFKLPKSNYRDIHFTNAVFSADNKFVIGTIFRNIYVWHSANGRLLTDLQAPVGVIEQLLVPDDRGQIITHLADSDQIHVWGLADAIGHVTTPDRLTRPVEEIVVTSSGRRAFVRCQGSDEVGVLDMRTGQLEDLFTHPSEVVSLSTTPEGEYLFVATKPGRMSTSNKIWYLEQRQIIHEFGKRPAYSVPMELENTIISVGQRDTVFKSPYFISLFKLQQGTFEEHELKHEIKFVLAKPFVTPQDKYLVILTAEDYQDNCAHFTNPTICAIALKSNMAAMSTFGAGELRDVIPVRRILHIRPMPNNSYTIVVFYTNEPDITSGRKRLRGYDHCHGFLIFDICSGVVCQVIDDFLAPSTPMDSVIFASDVSICIDDQSNIFDMGTGYYVKQLHDKPVQPRALALDSRVAIYYSGSVVYAIRIWDGQRISTVDTHHHINCLQVCSDTRTFVVGCKDGALLAYIIIDPQNDDVGQILPTIHSRQSSASIKTKNRTWDRIDTPGLPAYSRPPSTVRMGPSDKEMLKKIKHVPRSRPSSDTSLYKNTSSQICTIM